MSGKIEEHVGAVGAIQQQVSQSLAGTVNSISTLHIVLEADPMTEATWLQTPTDILDFILIKFGTPSLDTLCV